MTKLRICEHNNGQTFHKIIDKEDYTFVQYSKQCSNLLSWTTGKSRSRGAPIPYSQFTWLFHKESGW